MKLTTAKIKDLISSWLKENEEFKNYFNDYFGTVGFSLIGSHGVKEYTKKFKCEPNEIAVTNAIRDYVSNGKNWKRYEKCKYNPLDEEMNKNLVDGGWENTKIVGWESDLFQKDNKNYILRKFMSKLDDFEENDLFVISDEKDEEVLSWAIWDH